MLTVHLITKNNQKTIESTLNSVIAFQPKILVGDFGSTDGTIEICKKFNAQIINVQGMNRNEARSILNNQSKTKWNLWIEPWEIILQNPLSYQKLKENFGYVRIIHNQTVTWSIRLWQGQCRFTNPVFEVIKSDHAQNSSMVLSSHGSVNSVDSMKAIQKWKADEPLSNLPYYYQSCLLLTEGRYDEFLKEAEHYLFLDKSFGMSSTMTRYYYAMVQLIQKRAVKTTLQNLNLCLCVNPLMAEFWCLTGDVYYHILHKFSLAKEFYENAIIMGAKRLSSDRWPMDIPKYNKYPKMMIESCDKILNNHFDYLPIIS